MSRSKLFCHNSINKVFSALSLDVVETPLSNFLPSFARSFFSLLADKEASLTFFLSWTTTTTTNTTTTNILTPISGHFTIHQRCHKVFHFLTHSLTHHFPLLSFSHCVYVSISFLLSSTCRCSLLLSPPFSSTDGENIVCLTFPSRWHFCLSIFAAYATLPNYCCQIGCLIRVQTFSTHLYTLIISNERHLNKPKEWALLLCGTCVRAFVPSCMYVEPPQIAFSLSFYFIWF